MKANDFLSGAVLAALGLFFVATGKDLGLGRLNDPGSGFLIFWVGWALTALATGILGQAWRAAGDLGLAAAWQGADWRKLGYVVVVLALHAYAMPVLGFVLATAVLMVVLFKTVEPQPWPTALIGAVASTGLAWLLFVKALGTQLPVGALGIG
ncbi:MAG: tripartite tricarboxylate transporter TctB family protein [Alphaproteobacteria bacterium]|nr:tripartite tricarboxylate transporter TctB family protein [Alphaproteobacteria bacterium]